MVEESRTIHKPYRTAQGKQRHVWLLKMTCPTCGGIKTPLRNVKLRTFWCDGTRLPKSLHNTALAGSVDRTQMLPLTDSRVETPVTESKQKTNKKKGSKT